MLYDLAISVGVQIHFNTAVVSLNVSHDSDARHHQRQQSGFVQPSITTSDGKTRSGDLVIGADGVFSTIRRCIHPNVSPSADVEYWCSRYSSSPRVYVIFVLPRHHSAIIDGRRLRADPQLRKLMEKDVVRIYISVPCGSQCETHNSAFPDKRIDGAFYSFLGFSDSEDP